MTTGERDSADFGGFGGARFAHVLFADVANYTLLSLREQVHVREQLSALLSDGLFEGALLFDTGDGFAAVYEQEALGPVRGAMRVARRVREAVTPWSGWPSVIAQGLSDPCQVFACAVTSVNNVPDANKTVWDKVNGGTLITADTVEQTYHAGALDIARAINEVNNPRFAGGG